jgi:hypothetical protein
MTRLKKFLVHYFSYLFDEFNLKLLSVDLMVSQKKKKFQDKFPDKYIYIFLTFDMLVRLLCALLIF